jgi:predicted ATPase
LARLIVAASSRSQVWVVSHASRLIAALEQAPACHSVHLHKEHGRTLLSGQGLLDAPAWHWPRR